MPPKNTLLSGLPFEILSICNTTRQFSKKLQWQLTRLNHQNPNLSNTPQPTEEKGSNPHQLTSAKRATQALHACATTHHSARQTPQRPPPKRHIPHQWWTGQHPTQSKTIYRASLSQSRTWQLSTSTTTPSHILWYSLWSALSSVQYGILWGSTASGVNKCGPWTRPTHCNRWRRSTTQTSSSTSTFITPRCPQTTFPALHQPGLHDPAVIPVP